MQGMNVSYVSGGDRIDAWLYLPKATPPFPAIVFCPGFTGTKYAAYYQPYVEALVGAGYAVLLGDYRGWGDSEGLRGYIDPRMQTDDIRAGISFLEAHDDTASDRIGLFGVSYGGGHATYVNAVDKRVRAGVAISGVADGVEFLRRMRREYEWSEFLEGLAGELRRVAIGEAPSLVHPNERIQVATPERRQTQVKGNVPASKVPDQTPLICAQPILDYSPRRYAAEARRMLWICLEHDVVVPADHSRMMFGLASQPKRLVVLPGKNHYDAYIEHFDVIWAEVERWLQTHLGAPSAQAFDQ